MKSDLIQFSDANSHPSVGGGWPSEDLDSSFERTGGVYVEGADGTTIYPEDIAEIGDVVYVNPPTPHGVEMIDGGAEPDWVPFPGRWTMLFAINKLGTSEAVSGSVDFENSGQGST